MPAATSTSWRERLAITLAMGWLFRVVCLLCGLPSGNANRSAFDKIHDARVRWEINHGR